MDAIGALGLALSQTALALTQKEVFFDSSVYIFQESRQHIEKFRLHRHRCQHYNFDKKRRELVEINRGASHQKVPRPIKTGMHDVGMTSAR